MRKFYIFILSVALSLALDTLKAEYERPGADVLLDRMTALREKGYMFGHQDDTFYGLTWEWDYGRSDVYDTVGDFPAIMGFDLGGIELQNDKNLDNVPFDKIREELIKHHLRGGIVTLSWHPRNPVTDGTAWDTSDNQVVHKVLTVDKFKKKFMEWITRVGDFIATLKTEDGKKVPIIFRPWHENNGSWFWWGQNLCSDEDYKAFWNLLQDYLRGRGFDNLLWSYSPNLDGGWNEKRFLARYPGNDRVQLIGEDAYQWGTEEDFVKALTADLDFLYAFSTKNNKLFAMTECGMKNLPDATWWTRVLKPIMDRYPICYFHTWRNYIEEFFAPDPRQESAADFKKLYNAPNFLFLKEIIQKI
jgi:hypothetical protein